MDRFQYRNKWVKNGIIAGGAFFVFLLVAGLLLIRPASRQIETTEARLREARNRQRDLNRLSESVVEYRQKQREVEEITEEFMNYLGDVGTNQEKFNSQITELSEEAEIRIRERKRGAGYDTAAGYQKQLWEIGWRSGYHSILRFIRNLEASGSFWGINEFQIKSGRDKREHSADMNIYNVVDLTTELAPGEVGGDDLDSLLALPENTLDTVENLIRLTEYRHIDIDIDKDPLYYGDTIFEREVREEPARAPVPSPPRLNLSGIVWEEDDQAAIIDGEIRRVGDRIRGAEVIRITRRYVLLKWRTRYIRLEID